MKRISLRFDLGYYSTSQHVCSHWFRVCFHCPDLWPTIIWLEMMFTAYWFRFLPTVQHSCSFSPDNFFCPVVKCCIMFRILKIELYSIYIIFSCIVGVLQNTGWKICWENWRDSSAATGSAATIFNKTSSCILTKRASRTQKKLMTVAHI